MILVRVIFGSLASASNLIVQWGISVLLFFRLPSG